MSHTPGPWIAERGNAGSEHPLFVTAPGQSGFRPWSDEDARLIAAAPDLLEALKNIRSLSRMSGIDRGDAAINALAEQAIAKAEGRE